RERRGGHRQPVCVPLPPGQGGRHPLGALVRGRGQRLRADGGHARDPAAAAAAGGRHRGHARRQLGPAPAGGLPAREGASAHGGRGRRLPAAGRLQAVPPGAGPHGRPAGPPAAGGGARAAAGGGARARAAGGALPQARAARGRGRGGRAGPGAQPAPARLGRHELPHPARPGGARGLPEPHEARVRRHGQAPRPRGQHARGAECAQARGRSFAAR
ncbi:unnamed protein product, partial [Heterosigma akashiwo]